jgi:hypothetical protein
MKIISLAWRTYKSKLVRI